MKDTVTLEISDLFFMVDNSTYWSLLRENEEESLEALIQNAKEFTMLLNSLGHDIQHEDVVSDFLERV